ncbi:Zinc transporter ZIP13 [Fasciola gigantica]|uniref:Zinc transporter ZIP13 n=1 Tax=Fasciola gigantica TaxID=46835 RepID=A0A504YM34_FASGI|nr:Zinc transporter ZIP13 [Fasciola gigantica]
MALLASSSTWKSMLYWDQTTYTDSIICIVSAFVVGLSGIVPLLFIPIQTTKRLDGTGTHILNRWLSYATGSLLGEVFLHLLPEPGTLDKEAIDYSHRASFWALIGILFFFMIERLAACKVEAKQIEGYLNLLANVIDNFTHGVAIGGSYLVSLRLGILTTICILVHEIPHEMGDFVILLRNGFTRWQAAKAQALSFLIDHLPTFLSTKPRQFQLVTASGSTFGAALTLAVNSTSSGLSIRCVLPFTAGGFLYIALVSLAPDLLKSRSPRESLIHVSLILLGLSSMYLVSHLFD